MLVATTTPTVPPSDTTPVLSPLRPTRPPLPAPTRPAMSAMSATAFCTHVPLRIAPSRGNGRRRTFSSACAAPPPSSGPKPGQIVRRAAAAATAAVLLAVAAPEMPARGLGLAPTPINPYARRRAEKAYVEYARALESKIEKMEVFPVGDLRNVVSHSAPTVGFRVAGFAAFFAATISTAIVHPLDSVKTRLQAGARSGPELFSGLYKGVFGNILKEAPNAAIYLAVYELIKTGLMHLPSTSLFRDLPLLTFMLAGALGDAVGSVVRVPAEVTNKRMQLGLSNSLPEAFRDVLCTRPGQASLRTAWVATLWRDMPYGGLQIMLYESGKVFLHGHAAALPGFIPASGMAADVLVGAVVAAIAAFVTTPADVLVTRIAMASSMEGPAPGIGTHLRAVVRESGPLGLFSGALQRSVIYMAMGGMFFSLYELASGIASNPHSMEIALRYAQSIFASSLAVVENVVGYFSAHPFSAVNYATVEQFPYLLSFLLLQS